MVNPSMPRRELEYVYASHVAQYVLRDALRARAGRIEPLRAATATALPAAWTYVRRTWCRLAGIGEAAEGADMLPWPEVEARLRVWIGEQDPLRFEN